MEIKSIVKRFESNVIFDGLSLTFDNPVTAIMGASGVGKTTLLRIIAGLEKCEGKVENVGKISFVFQDSALIENLTVLQNVAFACGNREKAKEFVEKVGLKDFSSYYPKKLSGGMKQRVNLARAFACGGTILMDEPFKQLDLPLKQRLIEIFLSLREQYQNNAVIVTHDVDEAISIADRIVFLKGSPARVVLDEQVSSETKKKISALSEGD